MRILHVYFKIIRQYYQQLQFFVLNDTCYALYEMEIKDISNIYYYHI